MFAQQLSTYNTSGQTNTKEFIVLHHTGTTAGSVSGVLQHLTTGKVSAHYVIDEHGLIYKIASDDDVLRHCGESSRQGRTQMNSCSIGIEIIGPLPGFTDEQRVAVRKLVSKLMHDYHIPADRIIRHRDIAPGRKVDPDDSLRSTQYPSFTAYQQSFGAVDMVMGFYRKLFQQEFAQAIQSKQTIIEDIDSIVSRVTNPDGSINIEELVYLINIGFERLHQHINHVQGQQKHTNLTPHIL